MVLLEAGKLPHRKFLSIWKLPELRGIELTADHAILGALTTYAEIRRHELLASEFPLLARAAAETGSIATQNRGTLGGNIANASPAADSPPALLVYDAELELVSANAARWIPYQGFWTGYKKIAMRSDELIRRVRLPRPAAGSVVTDAGAPAATKHYYRKVGTRRAQAISKVCFAAIAQIENNRIANARIALGSVAPKAKPPLLLFSEPRRRRSLAKSLPLTTSAPLRAIATASPKISSPNFSSCSRRDEHAGLNHIRGSRPPCHHSGRRTASHNPCSRWRDCRDHRFRRRRGRCIATRRRRSRDSSRSG